MGSLSIEIIFYIIFIFMGLLTGAIFWVMNKYRIPAVISLIFSLLAPLLTFLFVVQGNATKEAFGYITEEMSAGNTWARIVVIIHVFLVGWLLFLMTKGGIYLYQSPKVKDTVKNILAKIKTSPSEGSNQDSKSG